MPSKKPCQKVKFHKICRTTRQLETTKLQGRHHQRVKDKHTSPLRAQSTHKVKELYIQKSIPSMPDTSFYCTKERAPLPKHAIPNVLDYLPGSDTKNVSKKASVVRSALAFRQSQCSRSPILPSDPWLSESKSWSWIQWEKTHVHYFFCRPVRNSNEIPRAQEVQVALKALHRTLITASRLSWCFQTTGNLRIIPLNLWLVLTKIRPRTMENHLFT